MIWQPRTDLQKRIIDLALQGYSNVYIENALHCNEATVRTIRLRAGCPSSHGKPKYRPWLDEAKALWSNPHGPSSVEIAEMFGVTKGVIIGLANRCRWPARRITGAISTSSDRMAELHATLDKVLQDTDLKEKMYMPHKEATD